MPDTAALIAEATAARQRGDVAGAEAAYLRAIAAAPGHVQALSGLGVLYYQAGHHGPAAQRLGEALKAGGPSVAVLVNLGLARHGLGDYAGAVASYRQAIALKPDLATAHNSLGVSLLALKETDQAKAAFASAVQSDPTHGRAWFNLGTAQRETDELETAIASFERACALIPDFAQGYAGLASARQDLGDLEGALVDLRTALQLSPKDPVVLNNLALLLVKSGHAEEARDLLQAATAAAPQNPSLFSTLGLAQRGLNDSAALQSFEKAFRLRPNEMLHAYNLIFAITRGDLKAVDRSTVEAAFRSAYPGVYRETPGLGFKVSPAAPLAGWAHGAGIPPVEIDAPTTVTLKYGNPPHEDRYVAEGTTLFPIPDAEVISGWDYVIAPDGNILDGSGYMPIEQPFGWMPHGYCRGANQVMHVWPASAATVEQPAFFLSTPQNFQIGHWIIDFLPRLRARAFLPEGVKLAIPATLPRRHREMLSHFGVGEGDLLELAFGHRYRFKTLYLMGQGHRNDPHPGKVRYLHRMFMRDVAAGAGEKIYLQRNPSMRGRMIENQAEMDDILRAFGFKAVNLADLSVSEQAATVGRARVVIGAMGTDLSSIFYLHEGATLIALIQHDTVETNVDNDVRAFERYGAILNIPVRRLVCAPSQKKVRSVAAGSRTNYYRDMIIDSAKLHDLLRTLDA